MTTLLPAAAWVAVAMAVVACRDSGAPAVTLSSNTDGLPVLNVLSNRADLLSSGDALVDIAMPPGLSLSALRVDIDGRDVTAAFALRPNGKVQGVVTGLKVGTSLLRVRNPQGMGTQLRLTNHPQGGPVFSGPQIQPWLCATEENGLGPALDAQCNGKTFTGCNGPRRKKRRFESLTKTICYERRENIA